MLHPSGCRKAVPSGPSASISSATNGKKEAQVGSLLDCQECKLREPCWHPRLLPLREDVSIPWLQVTEASNLKDREAWHAAVPGVTKSQTQLSDRTTATTVTWRKGVGAEGYVQEQECSQAQWGTGKWNYRIHTLFTFFYHFLHNCFTLHSPFCVPWCTGMWQANMPLQHTCELYFLNLQVIFPAI